MADENSTLVGGAQTGVQPGDDFVIGFGNDDTSGSTDPTVTDSEISENEVNSGQNQEITTSDEPKEESQESSDSKISNDDFSDFDVFGSSDADFTETEPDVDENISTESENNIVITENKESSEETLSAEGSESTDNIIQDNNNSESQVPASVEEKKFVPLDENLGKDLNVDFDMGDGESVENNINIDGIDNQVKKENTFVENPKVEERSSNLSDNSDLFISSENVLDNPNETVDLPSENENLNIQETVVEDSIKNEESSIVENPTNEDENQVVKSESVLEDDFMFTKSDEEGENSVDHSVENKTSSEFLIDSNIEGKIENSENETSTENLEEKNDNRDIINDDSGNEIPVEELSQETSLINSEGDSIVETESIQSDGTVAALEENVKNLENNSDFSFSSEDNQNPVIDNEILENKETTEDSVQNIENDNFAAYEEIEPDSEVIQEQINNEASIENPSINEASMFVQNQEGNEENTRKFQDISQEESGASVNSMNDSSDTNDVAQTTENTIFRPTEQIVSNTPSNTDSQEIEQGFTDNEIVSFNQSTDSMVANPEAELKSDNFGSMDFSFDLPTDTDSNIEQEKMSETTQSDNELPIGEINIEPVAVPNTENLSDSQAQEEMFNITDNQVVAAESLTPVEDVQTSVENFQKPVEQAQTIETTPENINSEVQTTLSLDQIMDAELLSSNQILTQSAPSNIAAIPEKKNNKKLIAALMSVGLILVLGFVTVTAFPNLLSNNNSGSDLTTTGYTAPEVESPDMPEVLTPELGENQGDEHGSALNNSEFQLADPSIEYPEVEFPEPGIDPEPDFWEGEEIVADEPTPYIPEDFPEDEKEPEIQEVSFTEAMSVISSFKNQAEIYYDYGQEELDKLIIKYSSQIKYICENYESKITAGEGLDIESFKQFKSDVNLLISKINAHNGGSDAETYTVQEKSDKSDFEGKEEIRQYLYNK